MGRILAFNRKEQILSEEPLMDIEQDTEDLETDDINIKINRMNEKLEQFMQFTGDHYGSILSAAKYMCDVNERLQEENEKLKEENQVLKDELGEKEALNKELTCNMHMLEDMIIQQDDELKVMKQKKE